MFDVQGRGEGKGENGQWTRCVINIGNMRTVDRWIVKNIAFFTFFMYVIYGHACP